MRNRSTRQSPITIALLATTVLVAALTAGATAPRPDAGRRDDGGAEGQQYDLQKIMRGRQLVLEHACAGCHGGVFTPDADGWLVGARAETAFFTSFLIGPCATQPGAQPCWRTYARNLTPDNVTGIGRFTERQIFNALRYGLRPGETPDVEITGTKPGEGNFPASPKYLAPPMPWPAWRHMPDEDLRAIAAYLRQGVKPVSNRVEDSEGPPDFWAGIYAELETIAPYPASPFPTANEVRPADAGVDMHQVLRGRQVAIQHDCGACHGGVAPAGPGWLAGVGGLTVAFPVGPCAIEPGAEPCFMQRPRNLTPHATGIGGYTDRQLFNALRYGLRPSTTPDIAITSSVPGEGGFPASPDYLGAGMPWPGWRYMSDEDLWAVIAYLRHAVKPVANEVADSEGPPDNWASDHTVEKIGRYPAPPFPTANEVRR